MTPVNAEQEEKLNLWGFPVHGTFPRVLVSKGKWKNPTRMTKFLVHGGERQAQEKVRHVVKLP